MERLEDRTQPSVSFGGAFKLGGDRTDEGHAIAVDAAGGQYVAGYFSGTMDADPSAGEALLTSVTTADGFIAKYNPDGSLAWARRLGGPASGVTAGGGAVHITGQFAGTADFGGTALTSTGPSDGFLAKLDATTGDSLWARTIDAGHYDPTVWYSSEDAAHAVAVDGSGNAYVTGSLDGGDIFVRSYDAGGQLRWSHQLGQLDPDGGASGHGFGVATAGTNVHIVGDFIGQVDFDPGPGTFTLGSVQSKGSYTNDAFAWHLTDAGQHVWAGGMGGQGLDYAMGVAVDGAGDLLIAGQYGGTYNSSTYSSETASGSNDFDPGAGTASLTSAGLWDAFVVKLAPDHSFRWARGMGGAGTDVAMAVAADGSGKVFTTGMFGHGGPAADFDPGAGTHTLTSAGGYDVFVAALDGAGNFAWAGRVGGSDDDRGRGVAADASGNVLTTGYFLGQAIDFDPGAGTYPLDSTYNQEYSQYTRDAFVWKLRQSLPPPSPTLPTLGIGDVTRKEGRRGVTYFTFTVTLSAPSTEPVTVNFATADGTATAGSDYAAASGTLTFAPGETSRTITVEVYGDRTREADETFSLLLGGVTGAVLGDGEGLGTILNDD